MADINVERAESRDHDPRIDTVSTRVFSRINWGAVLAGLVIATVLQLVLALFGVAVGLTAFDSDDSARSFGIGGAIWGILVPLIALFVGGMTTGRLAGILSRTDGFLHGTLVWALSILFTVWLVGSGVGSIAGGAFGLIGDVASASAGGAVTASTDISQAEQERIGERVEAGLDSARGMVAEVRESAGRLGEEAADTAATATWLTLLALGLSLAAAAFGAMRTAPR